MRDETIAILNGDLGGLTVYSRTGAIPKPVRDALVKAAQMRQGIADVERQIQSLTQHVAEITAEQGRIRENMKTVAPSGQYYDRLLAKLNEQESTIEKLQADRAALIGKRNALGAELNEYLNGLTVG